MPITYNTAAGNARLVAGLTATGVPGQSVDGNSGPGVLVVGTSALAGSIGALCSFPLPKPSHSIANKQATLLGTPLNATPNANGTAALAELHDSAGTVIATGLTVGTSGSGADIIIATTTISTSIPAQVTSGLINTQ